MSKHTPPTRTRSHMHSFSDTGSHWWVSAQGGVLSTLLYTCFTTLTTHKHQDLVLVHLPHPSHLSCSCSPYCLYSRNQTNEASFSWYMASVKMQRKENLARHKMSLSVPTWWEISPTSYTITLATITVWQMTPMSWNKIIYYLWVSVVKHTRNVVLLLSWDGC